MHPTLPRRCPASARRRRAESIGGLSSLLLASSLACGASAEGPSPTAALSDADRNMYEGPPFYEQPGVTLDPSMPSAGGAPPDFMPDNPEIGGPISPACVISEGNVQDVRQPVDIILLLDNSGSMEDELEAVEANINVNFASVLNERNVDYHLILISRHRQEPRDESEEASTSICVTSPLSGLDSCDDAEQPRFTESFFQYSTKLESTDSFDVALDTYELPIDSEREEKFDQAPLGWSDWLRPLAKKVFLEMTDDNEDMPIDDFVGGLVTMAPQHFGADPANPTFVFHSIIGLAEKPVPTEAYAPDEPVQPELCDGNDNEVTNAGESYQELSIRTGGLRFPLCQFGAYDVVFQKIADDVVQRAAACDFPFPLPPAGLELDLPRVAIRYTPGAGDEIDFKQAPTVADCQADAFYVANDRLNLCPDTCTAVRSDPLARVQALFTCRSQLIVPR
jgi:hypothetical protein